VKGNDQMYTITLDITRTETWRPEITIPEKDRKAFAHMPDEQAHDYILKLADEMSDYVFDEYHHKYTLETETDIDICDY
tara:strand:- start:1348 stop:1584 length:237 start_codon:yes stop_codon:yes gene_type:complete